MRANNGAPMTPTVIITRPALQGISFADDIAARWQGPLRIIQSPLLEIVAVPAQIDPPDSVIFTSANGVMAAKKMALPRGIRAWCVGTKTAQAAQDAGFVPITGPGDAQRLVADIIAAAPTGQIAHIRGRHARGDVCAQLKAAGLQCLDVVAYDQQPRLFSSEAKEALAQQVPLIFPLFSPRTATIFSKQGPFVAPVHVIALSEAVKDAVDMRLVTSVVIADEPNAKMMQAATIFAMQALTRKG